MNVKNEDLLKRLQEGDKEAREELVKENIGLVRHIIKRYQGRGYDLEDLFQIGSIGLIKAIDKFQFSYQVCFSTYAVPMILGEIKRFLRDDGLLKISRIVKENAVKIKKISSDFLEKEGREASIDELERETGLEKSDIVLALDADKEVTSIYQSVYQKDGNEIRLLDQLAQKKENVFTFDTVLPTQEIDMEKEDLLNQIVLEQLLKSLEDTEKKVIELRYFQDKTQMEVASILGLTQVKVSRMEKKCLGKMREQVLISRQK